jgi:hypothetical protein
MSKLGFESLFPSLAARFARLTRYGSATEVAGFAARAVSRQ